MNVCTVIRRIHAEEFCVNLYAFVFIHSTRRIALKHPVKNIIFCSLFMLLSMLFSCLSLWAQAGASLQGSVMDSSGAYVPHATVVIHATSFNFKRVVQSDLAGRFTITELPSGNYQVEVNAKGFRTLLVRKVTVTDKEPTSLDMHLTVAGSQEKVNVVDAPDKLASFNAEKVTLGPLGPASELDTSYSVTTIPENIIESQHITNMNDLFKFDPSAQFEQRFGYNVGRLQSRGFQSGNNQNAMIDDMNLFEITQFPLAAFESLEISNGVMGSLYGPAPPSGTFVFRLKRPTNNRMEKIGADYDDMGERTLHGDFSGSIGPRNIIGYRINLLEGNGTSWVAMSRVRQDMESGNFDLHLARRTVLELNYLHSQYLELGLPGSFTYAYTIKLPSAPDPSRPGLGQPFAGIDTGGVTFVARLKHEFSDDLRLSAAVGTQSNPRKMYNVGNTISSNAGAYTASMQPNYDKNTVRTALLYINGDMKTGKVTHHLVLGSHAFSALKYGPVSNAQGIQLSLKNATLYNPVVASAVTLPSFAATYKNGNGGQESLIVGDTAVYGRWIATFAGSMNWLFQRSFSTSGQEVTTNGVSYYQHNFTPSASLAYKLKQNMTGYFSYTDTVTSGDFTGTNTTVNPNQYLAPIRTDQYEAGYKYKITPELETTVALFHTARPYAYAANSSSPYEIQGHQVNRGLEFMAKGNATHDLNLFGGVTWLDSRMRHTVNTAAEGKQYTGAFRVQGNILADYQLTPIHALRDIALNMDVHFMGHRAANDTNTYAIPGYVTLDLGARYAHKFGRTVATGDFGVKNVNNQFYWSTIIPGSQNGSISSSGGSSQDSATLGVPRTYHFSLLFTLP